MNLTKLKLLFFGATLIVPAISVVSCTKKASHAPHIILPLKNLISKYHIEKTNVDHNGDKTTNFQFKGSVDDLSAFNGLPSGFDDSNIYTLPKEVYNAIIDVFNQVKGTYDTQTLADALGYSSAELPNLIGAKAVATAIITDKEFHVEIFPYNTALAHEVDYLRSSDTFQIEEVNVADLGTWMARVKFFEKGVDAAWEHGLSKKSNYGIFGYPLYFVNTEFAQLGVSSQDVNPNQIYQISYDHNA